MQAVFHRKKYSQLCMMYLQVVFLVSQYKAVSPAILPSSLCPQLIQVLVTNTLPIWHRQMMDKISRSFNSPPAFLKLSKLKIEEINRFTIYEPLLFWAITTKPNLHNCLVFINLFLGYVLLTHTLPAWHR